MRNGFALFAILFAVGALANPFRPEDISQRFTNSNKFESEDLAWYRLEYSQGKWSKKFRVHIGPAANLSLSQKKQVTFENRYFYLHADPAALAQKLNFLDTFGAEKKVTISKPQISESGTKSFSLTMDVSNFWIGNLIVRCWVEMDQGGPFQSKKTSFVRTQLHLSSCVVNNQLKILEDGWLTFDAHQFGQEKNRTALHLRSFYMYTLAEVAGHKKSPKEQGDIAIGLSDKILKVLFGQLGFKVDNSRLWQHDL